MQQIVSITSQGQLTIPKAFLEDLGIFEATKAIVQRNGKSILVLPTKDFWSLGGSLKSKIKLSDEDLKRARAGFAESWGNNE